MQASRLSTSAFPAALGIVRLCARAAVARSGTRQASADFQGVKLPSEATGRVMSAQANFYRVMVDSSCLPAGTPEKELLCKMRSLLRKKGGYILVGDRVHMVGIDWQDYRALVSDVHPRETELHDPKVANVDHFALVFAATDPPFEAFQATRFLVSAEAAGISCTVVINKEDLAPHGELDTLLSRIRSWGYAAISASVHSGSGLDKVKKALVGRVTVFAGPSGVGKSSIINALRAASFDATQQRRLAGFGKKMAEEYLWREPDIGGDMGPSTVQPEPKGLQVAGHLKSVSDAGTVQVHPPVSFQASWKKGSDNLYGAQVVGNVGRRSRRGRHTTRSATLLDLPSTGAAGDNCGTLLVDTPGFSYPSMHAAKAQLVGQYFPEIRARLASGRCQFADCTHTHEPGCHVGNEWERYHLYARIRDELTEKEEVEATKLQMQKKLRQGTTKTHKGKGGEDIEVARLDAKQYRRESRTAKRVVVRDLLQDL